MWREQGPGQSEAAADWYSEVEYIQSGQQWAFNALHELLNFLRQQAEDPEAESHSAGE